MDDRVTFLKVENVWKVYAGLTVLERVNLSVAGNEFCSIVGASGCGKSTFLRMLMSEAHPSRGEISFDGAPLPLEPTPDRGVVFQRYSVFPHLSAVENVCLGREFSQAPLLGRLVGAARRHALDEAAHFLEAVGLAAARDKYPHELSGGMQQRLAIAQALIRRPRMLLLDEPFGALDPGTRRQMHELMAQVCAEHAVLVFLVTHDLAEGFALGSRLLVFDKVRVDPQAPGAYGATITYDLPLDRKPAAEAVRDLREELEEKSAKELRYVGNDGTTRPSPAV